MESLGQSPQRAHGLAPQGLRRSASRWRRAELARDEGWVPTRHGHRRPSWHNRSMSTATSQSAVAARFALRRREEEEQLLSPLAARSYPARRARAEEQCELRTPFQRARDRCARERFGEGFRHNEHSLRVVDVLERDGAGLNLSEQVRDGIVGHSSRAPLPATLEGRIVRLVDRIAYINHDIDDAVRAGVLAPGDLPGDEIAVL